MPNYYELDDFQVRTPTDILGQHIHLVKFDVTSSDGAGNGFNYEDGTFSPDEVREVIENINKGGGLFPSLDFTPGSAEHLTPKTIPYFGDNGGKWLGAQATIQRWYADPVTSNGGVDRTLRTIFTHDHFGPSTHQQVGLYAGLLVEPDGSRWQEPVTGTFLGTGLGRPVGANGQTIDDGGPTSWQANILTANCEGQLPRVRARVRRIGSSATSRAACRRPSASPTCGTRPAIRPAGSSGAGPTNRRRHSLRRWRRPPARRTYRRRRRAS